MSDIGPASSFEEPAQTRTRSPLHIHVALWLKWRAVEARTRESVSGRLHGRILSAIYRAYSLVFLSMDVPVSSRMSYSVVVHHSIGLVINDRAVIGDHVQLRCNTVIGSKGSDTAAPVLEAGVDVGANAVIIGDVRVGRDSVIGAGSVVVRDVLPRSVVAGNPAREVAKRTPEANWS